MEKDVIALFSLACSMKLTESWDFSISFFLTTDDHKYAIKS